MSLMQMFSEGNLKFTVALAEYRQIRLVVLRSDDKSEFSENHWKLAPRIGIQVELAVESRRRF